MIKETLKEELKAKADKANTATEVTNRIVKECLECAEIGLYKETVHIATDVVEEVLANLQNEYTTLTVEWSHNNWYVISWED